LLKTAADPASGFQFHSRAVIDALKTLNSNGKLTPADKQLLVNRLTDHSPRTRELALYYFTLLGAPATPAVEERLTRIVRNDSSPASRELAIVNLRSSFGPTATVRETLREIMQRDPNHAVQCRAAIAFAQMHARMDAGAPQRREALHDLERFFRQYGDGCGRADGEWGWRPLGNALLDYGPAGVELFERLMRESTNRDLSDRAWRILYLKQGDKFFPLTAEADAAAHRKHPWRH
jgi:hypothetical protein